MSTKVLERIRQLVHLAASSPWLNQKTSSSCVDCKLCKACKEEQEGRSAALQACRLIEKHGLLFVGEVDPAAPVPPLSEPGVPAKRSRPSARVRVPMRAVNGVEAVGKVIHDVAIEAASRITVKDVVDVFARRRR